MRGLLLALLLAGFAHADGKAFSLQVPVVRTPDQQAILVFRDGVETLVIETSYERPAREDMVVWVVPLPSVPTRVEPASRDLFLTARAIFAPRVEAGRAGLWGPGLFLFVVVSLFAWLGFQTRVGVASGALLIVAIVLGLAWSLVILVPKGAMGAGVTVHAREQVGSYDTATISAVEPAKLLGWLERNGFEVAAGSRAAIEDYVKRGWVFVVLKLKEADDPDEPMRRPHPVAFTFKTDKLVYPMRLTGVENGECDLELFVFADRWVTCDRLDPVFAREVEVGEEHEAPVLWTGSWRETIEIRHRQLGALVGRAMRLTRLAASLTPAEMREDLSFGWTDRVEEPALYTPMAAFDEALTTGAWVSFLALLPLLLIASRFRKLEPAKGRQRIALAWLIAVWTGVTMGVVQYGRLEVVEMRAAIGDDVWGGHLSLVSLFEETRVSGEADARRIAETFWARFENPLTGGDVIESASPGNYRISMREGRAVYTWFDARGGEFGKPGS